MSVRPAQRSFGSLSASSEVLNPILKARSRRWLTATALAVNLPMLDRMYKEYEPVAAPTSMENLAERIRGADAFLFVVGEYNWGIQPGLKNLTDHFLEERFWRPAAISSYSFGRLSRTPSAYAWRNILSEMDMVVISSSLAVGPITETLDDVGEPIGDAGKALSRAFQSLRRRSDMVDRSREGSARQEEAALLRDRATAPRSIKDASRKSSGESRRGRSREGRSKLSLRETALNSGVYNSAL
jgi:NAD(P)H-dependent FMN reductase